MDKAFALAVETVCYMSDFFDDGGETEVWEALPHYFEEALKSNEGKEDIVEKLVEEVKDYVCDFFDDGGEDVWSDLPKSISKALKSTRDYKKDWNDILGRDEDDDSQRITYATEPVANLIKDTRAMPVEDKLTDTWEEIKHYKIKDLAINVREKYRQYNHSMGQTYSDIKIYAKLDKQSKWKKIYIDRECRQKFFFRAERLGKCGYYFSEKENLKFWDEVKCIRASLGDTEKARMDEAYKKGYEAAMKEVANGRR